MSALLLRKGYEVFGLVRDPVQSDFWRLEELGVRHHVSLLQGDLQNHASLVEAVRRVQPDEVYNLAAQSFVAVSWEHPLRTADVNALGTLRLLDVVRHHAPTVRFYQASTIEMYGERPMEVLAGRSPLHPRSPYAVSKLFAHWMTVNFRESFGLFACCGILSNHDSPLRSTAFVTRKVSDGVARIALGLADSLTLGNLDARRDWGFAGDYVDAMWRMLQQREPDDYILSTGMVHSIRDLLTIAFRHIGIEDWTPYVRQDPTLLRPVEVQELSGGNGKAREKLGWLPRVNFEELVHMMVDADRKRLAAREHSEV